MCVVSPLQCSIVQPCIPMQVVDAMRTTISNMVGVLPPQLFDVTVSTVGESLAQLMFSVLMTGERPHRHRKTSLLGSPGLPTCDQHLG